MRRGVTLLELAVVLGIIAIMTALAVGSLQRVKSRASFSGVSNEVVSELKRTRIEALNKGVYTAFIINTNATGANANTWWGIQTTNGFDLPTFQSNPWGCNTPPSCVILTNGTLPTGISFGPATGYGAALPAPLNGIALAATSKCSFCASSPAGWGSVLFSPGGAPTFSNTPAGTGQQFTLQGTLDTGTTTPRIRTIAVVAKNGLIESYEK
jgi:prepilin-type N-terminal cleavage/methylation domain-containing protein